MNGVYDVCHTNAIMAIISTNSPIQIQTHIQHTHTLMMTTVRGRAKAYLSKRFSAICSKCLKAHCQCSISTFANFNQVL